MAFIARSVMMTSVYGVVLAVPLGMSGCDEAVAAGTARVVIAGKSFTLEVAADNDTRYKGLSGRTHIEDDGGMLFVFPPTQVQVAGFVMRDCPIPIDILYLDATGRVLTTHAMQPEPPRGKDEGFAGEAPQVANAKYNGRLKQYSSRYATGLVVELAGGMVAKLGVKEGDLVEVLDLEGLKKKAR